MRKLDERLFCSDCGEPYSVKDTEKYRNLICACRIISTRKDLEVKVMAHAESQ